MKRLSNAPRHVVSRGGSIHRRAVLERLAIGAAATTVASLWPMFGASAAPLKYTLQPQKIAPGVWMIAGANEAITRENGGAIANIAILDTRDGAVVIDTGPSRRYGEALKALAEELTGKPVVRALVTHFHPDHVFGNQAFDAKVLATSKGVVDGLKVSGEDFSTAMYHLAGDWMRGTDLVLPQTIIKNTFEDIGERRLQYLVLDGHTDTDVAIFDERSGVLFAGDLIFLDRAPTTPHANLPKWLKNLRKLEETGYAIAVPGHGPAEKSVRGVQQTRDWLNAVEDKIRKAFEQGLSMTEAMALPLPTWTEKIALAEYEFQRTVMHFYPVLETGNWPRVDRS